MLGLAIAAGTPPLGQQVNLAPRFNMPGDRLRPPKPKRRQDHDDVDALQLAEAKRARKRDRNAVLQMRGAFQQLAVSR